MADDSRFLVAHEHGNVRDTHTTLQENPSEGMAEAMGSRLPLPMVTEAALILWQPYKIEDPLQVPVPGGRWRLLAPTPAEQEIMFPITQWKCLQPFHQEVGNPGIDRLIGLRAPNFDIVAD